MNIAIPPNQEHVEHENIALSRREGRPLRPADRYLIQVLDHNWQGCLVEIDDPVPTGRQILIAADKTPVENHLLLLFDDKAVLEEVNLDEPIDVYNKGIEQFIAFDSDRLFYVALDGQRFPWGHARINEDVVRRIGRVPEDYVIWLERRNRPDQLLTPGC